MMAIYGKTALEMLYDQVNRDNPQLPAPLSADNVVLYGGPYTTNLGTSGRNTRIVFYALLGKGYSGKLELFYDRLDITSLFVNQTVSITQYTIAVRGDLIAAINAKYGLALTADDFTTGTVNSTVASSLTSGSLALTFNASNYVWKGTLTVAWTRGVAQVADYYPNRVLTQLISRDAIVKSFITDYTAQTSTLTAHDTTVAFTTGSATATAIVNMMSSVLGLPFTLGSTTTPGVGQYDLSGFTMARYTADLVAQSNPYYANVAILTPPTAWGLQSESLYLHYNPVSR